MRTIFDVAHVHTARAPWSIDLQVARSFIPITGDE